jgi:hypothetical protein
VGRLAWQLAAVGVEMRSVAVEGAAAEPGLRSDSAS